MNIIFFTNNICENTNKTSDAHFISNRRTLYCFKKFLLETFEYCKNKSE